MSVHETRFVFQDPYASLNPRMTVRDALAEPLRMHGVTPDGGLDAHLAGLLESVGMPADALSRYPHAFSGGQRQRTCIARALALRPEVIVADEATAALDVSLRAQVLDLLIALQRREGMTFVFISHDMGVVRYFCDRVAVMRRGKVVEFGSVDEICDRPQHEYT
jgi:peptide/nickel transport system ATP-binding protein